MGGRRRRLRPHRRDAAAARPARGARRLPGAALPGAPPCRARGAGGPGRAAGPGSRSGTPPPSALSRLAEQLAGLREPARRPATRTTIRLVLTPERVVAAETRRTLTALALHGLHVDGVVANRLVPDPGSGRGAAAAWLRERRREQEAVLAELTELAGGGRGPGPLDRATAPGNRWVPTRSPGSPTTCTATTTRSRARLRPPAAGPAAHRGGGHVRRQRVRARPPGARHRRRRRRPRPHRRRAGGHRRRAGAGRWRCRRCCAAVTWSPPTSTTTCCRSRSAPTPRSGCGDVTEPGGTEADRAARERMAREARATAGALLDWVGTRVDGAATARADGTSERPRQSPGPCTWCPVCALVAAVRGEQPELTAALAEHASGLLVVLRLLMQAHATGEQAGHDHAGHEHAGHAHPAPPPPAPDMAAAEAPGPDVPWDVAPHALFDPDPRPAAAGPPPDEAARPAPERPTGKRGPRPSPRRQTGAPSTAEARPRRRPGPAAVHDATTARSVAAVPVAAIPVAALPREGPGRGLDGRPLHPRAAHPRPSPTAPVLTVGVDIGGTSAKAGLVDADGHADHHPRRAHPARRRGPRRHRRRPRRAPGRRGALGGHRGRPPSASPWPGSSTGTAARSSFGAHLPWRDDPVVDADVGAPRAAGDPRARRQRRGPRRAPGRRGGGRAGSRVLVALGTGIGAALLVDGHRLPRRATASRPELGHLVRGPRRPAVPVREAGLPRALLQRDRPGDRRRRARRGQRGVLDAAGELGARAAAHRPGRRARPPRPGTGSRAGWSPTSRTGSGRGLALVADVFDPDVVVLGGEVSASAALFLDERGPPSTASRSPGAGHRRLAQVRPAVLGGDAGVVGAALDARERADLERSALVGTPRCASSSDARRVAGRTTSQPSPAVIASSPGTMPNPASPPPARAGQRRAARPRRPAAAGPSRLESPSRGSGGGSGGHEVLVRGVAPGGRDLGPRRSRRRRGWRGAGGVRPRRRRAGREEILGAAFGVRLGLSLRGRRQPHPGRRAVLGRVLGPSRRVGARPLGDDRRERRVDVLRQLEPAGVGRPGGPGGVVGAAGSSGRGVSSGSGELMRGSLR